MPGGTTVAGLIGAVAGPQNTGSDTGMGGWEAAAPERLSMSDAGTKPGAELELVHVTPEMIEAGLKAIDGFELLDVWEGYLSRADLVATIYRHMDQAARGKP